MLSRSVGTVGCFLGQLDVANGSAPPQRANQEAAAARRHGMIETRNSPPYS